MRSFTLQARVSSQSVPDRVGDAGSYSRRERIEKAAGDVLQFCRPKTRVVGDGNSTGKPGATSGSPFSLRGEPQQTP
jgi:hypothetical protein